MRIGELLVTAGLITESQLDEALKAQVMWGGRLGTNLVELGYVKLDDLSRALGMQHDLPAALGGHFAKADRDLQYMLPAEVAERFECVPLVRAGKHVVIASIAPLDERAVALVAGALDINRGLVVQSLAAEMRIKFHLERVYEIPRGQRYMRAKGAEEQSAVFSLPALAREEPSQVSQLPKTDLDDGRVLEPILGFDSGPLGYDPNVERRAYLRTLADMLKSHRDEQSVVAHVERTRAPVADIGATVPQILGEALADIALAPGRDELARRVIGTVARYIPESRSGLLLVVRGDAACSWTSFCRDGTELPPLAVPLDHVGLVAATMRRKKVVRGASGDLGPIDFLLLAALGLQYGDLVVAPFLIADHVFGMIVLATERKSSLAHLDAILGATSEGFTRLMKTALT